MAASAAARRDGLNATRWRGSGGAFVGLRRRSGVHTLVGDPDRPARTDHILKDGFVSGEHLFNFERAADKGFLASGEEGAERPMPLVRHLNNLADAGLRRETRETGEPHELRANMCARPSDNCLRGQATNRERPKRREGFSEEGWRAKERANLDEGERVDYRWVEVDRVSFNRRVGGKNWDRGRKRERPSAVESVVNLAEPTMPEISPATARSGETVISELEDLKLGAEG